MSGSLAFYQAGKTASSLTRKTQLALRMEIKSLLKKYALNELEKGAKNALKQSILSVIGLKTGKALFNDVLKILSPIYSEAGEKGVLEYFEEYFGNIYKELTAECTLGD